MTATPHGHRGNRIWIVVVRDPAILLPVAAACAVAGAGIPAARGCSLAPVFAPALAGMALRLWAFVTLGRFVTSEIMIRARQAVVSAGPEHFLRHPASYVLVSAKVPGVSSSGAIGFVRSPSAKSPWRASSDTSSGVIGSVRSPAPK